MGIKGLWSLLRPFCEKKSLHEVSGETVAVDLAGWVCDAQALQHATHHKLYLRNLFFRARALLLCDVRPLVVLDGVAPEAKRAELARRATARAAPAAPAPRRLARRRFAAVLSECESLLASMGVSCVRAPGEAEATCAALTASGVAHAVVTQDSDSLAYGARRVYRNLRAGGPGGGALHAYDAERISSETGLGRNKMVALAVLCGCDYGSLGCPLGATLAFLREVRDHEVLPRLASWTAPECAPAEPRSERETALRRRALAAAATAPAAHDTFPPPIVLREFLQPVEPPPPPPPPRPDLLAFVSMMRRKLQWSERDSVTQFLPLLTRAQLAAPPPIPPAADPLPPLRILAARRPRGVPCFVVEWDVARSQYDLLVPDQQLREGEWSGSVWRTCERQEAVRARYPHLVLQWERAAPPASGPALCPNRRRRRERSRRLLASMRDSALALALEQTPEQSETELSRLARGVVRGGAGTSAARVARVARRRVRLVYTRVASPQAHSTPLRRTSRA